MTVIKHDAHHTGMAGVIRDLMQSGARVTIAQARDHVRALGMIGTSAKDSLLRLRRRGEVHVCGWVSVPGGRPAAIYAYGPPPEGGEPPQPAFVPKPAPINPSRVDWLPPRGSELEVALRVLLGSNAPVRLEQLAQAAGVEPHEMGRMLGEASRAGYTQSRLRREPGPERPRPRIYTLTAEGRRALAYLEPMDLDDEPAPIKRVTRHWVPVRVAPGPASVFAWGGAA